MSLTEDSRYVAELVHSALLRAMSSLTAAHGCEVKHFGRSHPEPRTPDSHWVLTRVDFSALGLTGNLMLAATQQDAHGLWPLSTQNTTPTKEDLVSEFANCLLGSLQTQLYKNAIEISMATPQTLRGLAKSVLNRESPPDWERFRVRTAEVFTSVSVSVTPDFRWHPQAADDEPPLAEGDCIVF